MLYYEYAMIYQYNAERADSCFPSRAWEDAPSRVMFVYCIWNTVAGLKMFAP